MVRAVVISERGVVFDIADPPLEFCPVFADECTHCTDSVQVDATVDVPQWGFGKQTCSAQSISHAWTITKAHVQFCEGDVIEAQDCRYGNFPPNYVDNSVDPIMHPGFPTTYGVWVQGGMGQDCSILVSNPFPSSTCFNLPQNPPDGNHLCAVCNDFGLPNQIGWFTGMKFNTYIPAGEGMMAGFGSFFAPYSVISQDGLPVNEGCPVLGDQNGLQQQKKKLNYSITVS